MFPNINNSLGYSNLPELARNKLKQGIRVDSVNSSKRSINNYQPHPMNKTKDFKKPSLKEIVLSHKGSKNQMRAIQKEKMNDSISAIPEESEKDHSFVNLTQSRIEKLGKITKSSKSKMSDRKEHDLVENYLKGLSRKFPF